MENVHNGTKVFGGNILLHLGIFFSKWKNGIETDDTYTERFFKEILSKLKIEDVKQDFNYIDNPILLCYEKEGFCHRHLVCDWLNYHGLHCEEFKIEN